LIEVAQVVKRRLSDDPHPQAEERFERLLRAMAKLVFGKPEEEPQTSDAGRDEDCADTQTPIDTSEDAS
jgi:hypothetical protein